MTNETINILLVDDQPSRLLSYEVMLGDLGANLVKAASGADALQLLMKQEFAVILLDVNMSGTSGLEIGGSAGSARSRAPSTARTRPVGPAAR